MDLCIICEKEACYKCPQCSAKTCSLPCNKSHKDNCSPISIDLGVEPEPVSNPSIKCDPFLDKLRDSSELKDLLGNPDLRQTLQAIDHSDNPGDMLDKAMRVDINLQKFVEITQQVKLAQDDPQFPTISPSNPVDAFVQLLKKAIDE